MEWYYFEIKFNKAEQFRLCRVWAENEVTAEACIRETLKSVTQVEPYAYQYQGETVYYTLTTDKEDAAKMFVHFMSEMKSLRAQMLKAEEAQKAFLDALTDRNGEYFKKYRVIAGALFEYDEEELTARFVDMM